MKSVRASMLNLPQTLLALQEELRALHTRIDDLLERLDRRRDRRGRYVGPDCPAEGGKKERIGMEGNWQ